MFSEVSFNFLVFFLFCFLYPVGVDDKCTADSNEVCVTFVHLNIRKEDKEMSESLNLLMLNNTTAPGINWIMVIAGILLLGLSLIMFFKLRK